MNPMTNVKNTQKLNETELQLGLTGSTSSWHADFKDSAWIFIGGLPYELTEGDVICVFSQYGEVVHINLVRDKQSGKSKGFCFLCYEDQRSTVLAVDNLNSIKILGRTLRVNHVADYKMPKDHEEDDEVTKRLRDEGCAPEMEEELTQQEHIPKKHKKEKKKKAKKKKKKKVSESDSSSDGEMTSESIGQGSPARGHSRVKHERFDPGYEKYGQSDEDKDNQDDSKIKKQRLKVESRYGAGIKEEDYDDRGYEQESRDSRTRESDDRGYEQKSRDSRTRDYGDRKPERNPPQTIQYSENPRARSKEWSSQKTTRDYEYDGKHKNTPPVHSDYPDEIDSEDRYSRGRDRNVREYDQKYGSSRCDESRDGSAYDVDKRGHTSRHYNRNRSDERTNKERSQSSRSTRERSPELSRSHYRSSQEYSQRDHSSQERSGCNRRDRYRSRSPQRKQDKIKIVVEIKK